MSLYQRSKKNLIFLSIFLLIIILVFVFFKKNTYFTLLKYSFLCPKPFGTVHTEYHAAVEDKVNEYFEKYFAEKLSAENNSKIFCSSDVLGYDDKYIYAPAACTAFKNHDGILEYNTYNLEDRILEYSGDNFVIIGDHGHFLGVTSDKDHVAKKLPRQIFYNYLNQNYSHKYNNIRDNDNYDKNVDKAIDFFNIDMSSIKIFRYPGSNFGGSDFEIEIPAKWIFDNNNDYYRITFNTDYKANYNDRYEFIEIFVRRNKNLKDFIASTNKDYRATKATNKDSWEYYIGLFSDEDILDITNFNIAGNLAVRIDSNYYSHYYSNKSASIYKSYILIEYNNDLYIISGINDKIDSLDMESFKFIN